MHWILNNIVPGVQSYKYVESYKTQYWTELPGSGSSNAKPSNMPELKGKLDPNGNIQPDYLNDFSTGLDVDVSQHPNNGLLASIIECGVLPIWMNEISVPEPDSTTRRTRDTKGILEAHIESIGKDEDVVIREKRIVGGVPVNLENYYPWMAQIYVRNGEL